MLLQVQDEAKLCPFIMDIYYKSKEEKKNTTHTVVCRDSYADLDCAILWDYIRMFENSSVSESGNMYFNPQTSNALSKTCTEKKPIKRQVSK